MPRSKDRGLIFNVQLYCVHDGPGIRTTVFFKGCPLRCRWCSNPESQSSVPEVGLNILRCLGLKKCGLCLKSCPKGAIGGLIMPKVNRSLCLFCQDYFCRSACPAEALTVYGEMTSVEDIISRVEKDEVFYNRSGGGLTVSGGEPLNQPEFLLNLLTEAKQRRLKTAMETTGAAEFGVLKEVSRLLDTVLYDVKIIDSFKHKEFTCLDNTLILNNLLKLAEIRDPQTIYVRTPVVPGFNDNPQAAAELGRFLAKIPGINFEPLPYHRLGEGKYGYLSRPYLMGAGTLTEKAAEIFGETVEKQRQAEDAFSGDLLEKKDFELIH